MILVHAYKGRSNKPTMLKMDVAPRVGEFIYLENKAQLDCYKVEAVSHEILEGHAPRYTIRMNKSEEDAPST